MARNPDSMETKAGGQESAGTAGGGEFVTPPSRAERAMPRTEREQPLWPWLLIVAAVVIAAVIYYLVT
jgi:hypothetical protein